MIHNNIVWIGFFCAKRILLNMWELCLIPGATRSFEWRACEGQASMAWDILAQELPAWTEEPGDCSLWVLKEPGRTEWLTAHSEAYLQFQLKHRLGIIRGCFNIVYIFPEFIAWVLK